jgi:hypothetical protein
MAYKACSLMASVIVTTAAHAQEGLTLTLGRLLYSSQFLQQNISVKNNTPHRVRQVRIECGFFNHGQLIATDSTFLENIAPGSAGYKTSRR